MVAWKLYTVQLKRRGDTFAKQGIFAMSWMGAGKLRV